MTDLIDRAELRERLEATIDPGLDAPWTHAVIRECINVLLEAPPMSEKPRPIIREFAKVMESRMRAGDQRGWVWNEKAAQNCNGAELVQRAIDNLGDARRQWALGEAEAAEESFADAANLTMLAFSVMCALAKMAGGDLWAGSDAIFDGEPEGGTDE